MRKTRGICVVLSLVLIAVFLLCGCKAMREKRKRFNQAKTAALNVTLFANPLSAVYGQNGGKDARVIVDADSEACPLVSFEGLFSPFTGGQRISVAYDSGCLSHGLAISGEVTGEWKFEISFFKLYLDLLLTMDQMTVDGLTTDGTMHARASIDNRGPYAELDGDLVTTHADGRSRGLTVDNMTAYIDFNDVLLDFFFDNDDDLTDDTFLNPHDDVLVMNGSAQYTDEDNMTHAIAFDNCTQNFFCFFPSEGMITLVNEEEGYDALIDFGDGECDSIVTITIDGETQEVDLEKWLNRSWWQF